MIRLKILLELFSKGDVLFGNLFSKLTISVNLNGCKNEEFSVCSLKIRFNPIFSYFS